MQQDEIHDALALVLAAKHEGRVLAPNAFDHFSPALAELCAGIGSERERPRRQEGYVPPTRKPIPKRVQKKGWELAESLLKHFESYSLHSVDPVVSDIEAALEAAYQAGWDDRARAASRSGNSASAAAEWSEDKLRARFEARAVQLGKSVRGLLRSVGLAEDLFAHRPRHSRRLDTIEKLAKACKWSVPEMLGIADD